MLVLVSKVVTGSKVLVLKPAAVIWLLKLLFRLALAWARAVLLAASRVGVRRDEPDRPAALTTSEASLSLRPVRFSTMKLRATGAAVPGAYQREPSGLVTTPTIGGTKPSMRAW